MRLHVENMNGEAAAPILSGGGLISETGMAIGGAGGLTAAMCLLPLAMQPILFWISVFGAAAAGAISVGGMAAAAIEIGHRRQVHDLCTGGGLARPPLQAASVSGPEKNNG